MKKRVLSLFLSLALLLSAFLPALTIKASAVGTLYWPVPGHTTLSQGFHSGHNGIDIHDASINGATVINAMGGTVYRIFYCGTQHYGSFGDCQGFGTGLVIKGDDGWYYQYAHMQGGSIPSNVYSGAYVPAGAVLGRVGTTGNSSGPHLHFAIAANSTWWEPGINPSNQPYNYSNPSVNYANLGNEFYAYIQFLATGHGVCNVNNNVELGTYGTQSSLWRFVRQSDSSYVIVSAVNGTVMDVYNNETANETNIITFSSNGGLNQRFYLLKVANGYNIISAHSLKAVDVKYGANSTAGTNVHLFPHNTTVDQVFAINILDKWVQEDGRWVYYLNGAKLKNQWIKDGAWYYLCSDGYMAENQWVNGSNGKLCYVDGNGCMVTNQWLQIGGKWYYFNASGYMTTGWQRVDGKWYYLGSDGAMRSGWQEIDGNWYYLGTNMKTGWQKIDGLWYYFNSSGVMQTGWEKISGKWYYLDSSMKTGWQKIGSNWYYLGSNGTMCTGWQKIGGTWYYLGSNGVMCTGWQQISGTWYYFYSSGAMATGTVNISGTTYRFGSNGALMPA